MSAPLRLTATDLRNLATGLDDLSKTQIRFGVGPSRHSPSVSLRTEDRDVLTFDVKWVSDSTDGSSGEWVIDEWYGS